MTFLQLVNEVLNRLREPSVTAITNNTYSILISKMVNDSKRQVEDAWNWDALKTVVSVNTSASVSNQVITGSGLRQKGVVVNNATNKYPLINAPIQWIVDQQDLTTTQTGQPTHYAWNGTNGTDSKCEFYPTPNGTYTIKFHMYVPQADLSADGDTLTIPSAPVILGAFARALAERGEDGGLASSEAYALFKSALADHIAIESSRFVENKIWVAV